MRSWPAARPRAYGWRAPTRPPRARGRAGRAEGRGRGGRDGGARRGGAQGGAAGYLADGDGGTAGRREPKAWRAGDLGRRAGTGPRRPPGCVPLPPAGHPGAGPGVAGDPAGVIRLFGAEVRRLTARRMFRYLLL